MSTFRTRFANEIIAEFLPPKRMPKVSSRIAKPSRVMIILDGLPSVPSKRALLEYFSAQNFWVFHPRYRGTWESSGLFLEHSPDEDVRLVMDGIQKGFVDLYSDEHINISQPEFYLCGASFGGTASLLASRDPRVKKAIAFSPVVDWSVDSAVEPMDKLIHFIKVALREVYRARPSGWRKILSGKFYNPIQHVHELDGSKICILHAKDDDIVPYSSVAPFAKRIGSMFISRVRGGHFSSSTLLKPAYEKRLMKWLRT
jgi:esterase/lipase